MAVSGELLEGKNNTDNKRNNEDKLELTKIWRPNMLDNFVFYQTNQQCPIHKQNSFTQHIIMIPLITMFTNSEVLCLLQFFNDIFCVLHALKWKITIRLRERLIFSNSKMCYCLCMGCLVVLQHAFYFQQDNIAMISEGVLHL